MTDLQTEEPQILVGVSFDDSFRAKEFLTAAQRLGANGSLAIHDAVIVTCDGDGDTKVTETIDPTPGRAAFSGAVWTGLFGMIIGGPIGWVAGAAIGAGAGAAAAKAVDLGITDEWVDWFKASVQPGRTILALLVSDLDRNALVAETERFTGAELVYANLDEHTLGRIRTALGDQESVGATEAAADTSTESAP